MEIKIIASGSKGNCYKISDGVTHILIECGIPIKKIKEGLDFKLHEIKWCLVSHSHKDHSKSIEDVSKTGIVICANSNTLSNREVHNSFLMDGVVGFEIGTWRVMPFDVEHDVPCLGYLLQSKITKEKLLFVTDTNHVKYKFSGLTHIMIEANFSNDILKENVSNNVVDKSRYKRLLESHFGLNNLLEFFKANDLSKVKEIYLLHLSSDNADAESFKHEVEKATGKYVVVA